MSYKIMKAYGSLECYKCKRGFLQSTLILETRNLCGYYHYCFKCANDKGYSIDMGIFNFDKFIDVDKSYIDDSKNEWDILNFDLWKIK